MSMSDSRNTTGKAALEGPHGRGDRGRPRRHLWYFPQSRLRPRARLRGPGGGRHTAREISPLQGADVALQAAALAHAIAERQVFLDGNKRTAVTAMGFFLALNGYDVSASDDERFDWMIRLAHAWGPEELGNAVRPTLIPLDRRPLHVPPQTHARHLRRARTVSERVPRGREL